MNDATELQLPEPEFEHLYYIEVDVGAPLHVGRVNGGKDMIIPITGGRFEGERMSGSVLPIGADWNTMRPLRPGVRSRVSTRYVLKTDDGAVISLFTEGRARFGAKMVLDAIRKGRRRDPDATAYYFRQHLFFKTGDPRYAWLNTAVAFAVIGMNKDRKICYDAYTLR